MDYNTTYSDLSAIEKTDILKTFFNHTHYSIFLLNTDYRITFVNRHAWEGTKKMYGKEIQLGDSIFQYRIQGDAEVHSAFKENFEKVLATHQELTVEQELKFSSSTYWMRTEFIPIFDNGNKLNRILVNFQNIDDRKNLEALLEKLEWSLSHETKSPLASLMGLINILEKKELSELNQDIIVKMENQGSLLEKALSVAVIQANRKLK